MQTIPALQTLRLSFLCGTTSTWNGGQLAFDRKNNTPLSNLFVRILQHYDIEADRFGTSTGVLSEL